MWYNIAMKKVLFILIFVLFAGCEDDGLFIKKYSSLNNTIYIKSLSFKTDNYYLLDKVERSFKKYGFTVYDNKTTKYHIKLYSHYVISCKNPVVHALGADFNGYLGLEFYDGKNELYRIQKDFKSKVTNDMIDEVVKRLIKDMKSSPSR